MEIGFYEGAASMASLERWQEAISNNISSSATPGFKLTGVSMQAVGRGRIPTVTGSSFDSYMEGALPRARGMTDFRDGQISQTSAPSDLAIRGRGFFEVEAPGGGSIYTRNGQFHISPESRLVDSMGNLVMGDGGPIELSPGQGQLEVSADGTLRQGNVEIGRIRIVDFENPELSLSKTSGGFILNQGSENAKIDVESPEVLQGFLEGSNVSTVLEMVNLISVSRAFEANQKAIQAYDRNSSRAISALSPQ